MADKETNEEPIAPPEAEFVIRDLPTMKAITDSFRLQIVGLLDEPRTVKQLAALLNIAPFKLYYHINLLEQHGLIRVTHTRLVSGIPEKFYQRAAYKLRTDPALLSFSSPESGEDGLEVYLSSILDSTRADIVKSMQAGLISMSKDVPRARSLLSARGIVRLSPEQAEAFYARLAQVVQEFQDVDNDISDPDQQAHEFAIVFFPTLDKF